jgi:uncharacterized membrane protein
MAAKSTAAKKSSPKADTTMAIVAYILFFVPLLTESKNDAFVMFHVKQSLVLLLCWIALAIVGMIPVIGFFAGLLQLALFILWIIGILNAINGAEKELPIIGQYASKINL